MVSFLSWREYFEPSDLSPQLGMHPESIIAVYPSYADCFCIYGWPSHTLSRAPRVTSSLNLIKGVGMSIPSSRAIHTFLDEQPRLFNDKSRKDDFMALYPQIAPGGYSLERPANGDVLPRWDHLARLSPAGVQVQSSPVSPRANREAAGRGER